MTTSCEDDLPTLDLISMAESGGSFAYWHDAGEDIYSIDDGEPI